MPFISARSILPLALSFIAAFVAAFVVADLTISDNPDGILWFVASLVAAMAASGAAVALAQHLVDRRPPGSR